MLELAALINAKQPAAGSAAAGAEEPASKAGRAKPPAAAGTAQQALGKAAGSLVTSDRPRPARAGAHTAKPRAAAGGANGSSSSSRGIKARHAAPSARPGTAPSSTAAPTAATACAGGVQCAEMASAGTPKRGAGAGGLALSSTGGSRHPAHEASEHFYERYRWVEPQAVRAAATLMPNHAVSAAWHLC